jgi:hypothetical protein
LIEFPTFVQYLLVFVELTDEDENDFLWQPAIFYRYAFCLSEVPSGDLRQETLFGVRAFCAKLSNDVLGQFIAAFEPSEAALRIVSVALVNVRNPGPGNPACEALKVFIVRAHSSSYPKELIFLASAAILISKSLRCLQWEEHILVLVYAYVMRIFEIKPIHPVFFSLATALLNSLYKLGFQIDHRLLPRLIAFVPHAITPHVFSLIIKMCDSVPEKYVQLCYLIPELVRMLAAEIGDGIEIIDGMMCLALFHLLGRIVKACGDAEYGDLLFTFCTSRFMFPDRDNRDSIALLFRKIVRHGSTFS